MRRAVLANLGPGSEFVPDAWHAEEELWCFRVGLYLAPQPGDEHVDAAIKGFRVMPNNSMTQLVTRQYSARAGYECGQQRGLGTGQPHFPAVAIDKGVAG